MNFGSLSSLAIFAVVAISFLSALGFGLQALAKAQSPEPGAHVRQLALNGMPINCNSFRASWSVFAVVTTETFMPRALSTFI